MRRSGPFTRRELLRFSSSLAGAAALGKVFAVPVPALAESVAQDPRVAATPLVDKGFASTRKVGEGLYATIANSSKGLQAVSNGGFIVGKQAAMLIESHMTTAGAAYELETLRMVSQAPVSGALNTHYHFDHSFGNAFYGAQNITVWAHARAAGLMAERYAALQGRDKAPLLASLEKKLNEANDDTMRQRAQGDLGATNFLFTTVDATVLALPNYPLEPARLPITLDLGGLKAVIETYPGHTTTDIIVRIPELNVTYTGDLIFNGSYPVAFDGDMLAWRETLKHFESFGKDALFVPGHGQVCGPDCVVLLRNVLEDLGEQAEKLHKAGVPVEEAQHYYVIPERFKGLGMFSWSFTIGAAIANYYAGFSKKK